MSLRRVPLSTLFLGVCLLGAFAIEPGMGGTERLEVFVSVLPLKTFVEKIGGEHVEVQAMVRPGHNPHTYDPTPQQIAALSEARLYVRTGVPFEHSWMERIRSANPAMRVLDARGGTDSHAMQAPERDAEHAGSVAEARHPGAHREADESDPHVWTDPALVERMAARIRDKLAEIDPEHAQDYGRNYVVLAAELDQLDRDIRSLLAGLANRKFMVFHPAWGHFAKAYGLTQVAIEKEGKEPGPRALAALIEQATREGVKVVFVQPQYSRKAAEQIARAIGGRVVAVDPLSPDYAENLRSVARQIAEAARG